MKQEDSLEGSLIRVLFAAELEFPKIPQKVPRRYPDYLNMLGVNYAINGCSSLRTTPGA